MAEAPGSIAALRRFILDLAVRGKLVDQDLNDEPASELLKRIQAEEKKLVKEGKIKKQKPLPVFDDIEIPFNTPANWIWLRLGNIGDWGSSSTPPRGNSEYYDGDITWLKSGELGDSLSLKGSQEKISTIALEKCSFRLNQPGDVLIAMYGATIGKLAILDEVAVTNQAVCGCTPFNGVFNKYLFLFLASHRQAFHSQSEGGAQPNISKIKIVLSPFPLPPLREQHQIVAKVDELMDLCDRLEAAQKNRESLRDRLVAASLHQLNQAADSNEEFFDRARFYFDNLAKLSVRSEHIKQLRQNILNLAVSGKLTPQNPNDEPASKLLDKIKSEKEELIARKIIRKEKPLSSLKNEDFPFTIPSSWEWVKIGVVSLFTEYGTSQQSANSEFGVPVLKMGDIQEGRVIIGNHKKVPETIDDLPALYLKKFDLLYNRTNSAELVGKTGIYLGDDDQYTFASYLIRIRCSSFHTNPIYFNLAMNAPFFRVTQILPYVKQQCGQANVNGTILKNMAIPLPPLAEQHLIISKIDRLMLLCDQLEYQISNIKTDGLKLLNCLLQKALP